MCAHPSATAVAVKNKISGRATVVSAAAAPDIRHPLSAHREDKTYKRRTVVKLASPSLDSNCHPLLPTPLEQPASLRCGTHFVASYRGPVARRIRDVTFKSFCRCASERRRSHRLVVRFPRRILVLGWPGTRPTSEDDFVSCPVLAVASNFSPGLA